MGLLVVERYVWRRWLAARHRRGEDVARALLVGSVATVAELARALERAPQAGYRAVGACVPESVRAPKVPGTELAVLGHIPDVETVLATSGADTVIVTSTDELPPRRVKELSWSLEANRQHLALAPNLIDVAGPRLHTTPVAGIPLVHVQTPRYSSGQRLVKRLLDLLGSIVGVVVLSPLLIVLAILVRASSPGPVLFRQKRVGLQGREFQMLKFRSMVADAESRLDELPQLFNVIGGSMSLVGPRPPLPAEVARYASHVHRRFLVQPGITGLWQVSGRSALSWDETVRLDLSYVENWSLLGDLVIIAKTARAALRPGETAA